MWVWLEHKFAVRQSTTLTKSSLFSKNLARLWEDENFAQRFLIQVQTLNQVKVLNAWVDSVFSKFCIFCFWSRCFLIAWWGECRCTELERWSWWKGGRRERWSGFRAHHSSPLARKPSGTPSASWLQEVFHQNQNKNIWERCDSNALNNNNNNRNLGPKS